MPVIAMAVAMEAAKLITAGWLARRWRATALIWRAALVAFVFRLAVINAAGVYAQLVAAHVGDRGAVTSRLEEQTADLEAKISVQAHTVADLDRRLAQIDAAVEKATEKGRTTAAMKLADDQRKARAGLVDERKREAGISWQPCRRNAPVWPPRAGKSRRKLLPSDMSPSSSGSTPTANAPSGG
jgi:uncharacterized coiled-coil protein SlyX